MTKAPNAPARAGPMVCGRSRTRWVHTHTVPSATSVLRYAPPVISEDFHSGSDIQLQFLGCTYSFSLRDFEQRTLRAAQDLGLVGRKANRRVRADLLAAMLTGTVEQPRSGAGERINELAERGPDDPVYWLRKLVFRAAWVDHRIRHGLIDVQFDEASGSFRLAPGPHPLPDVAAPSFAAATVPEDRA